MIKLECWIDQESHLRHIQEQEATPEQAAEHLRQELHAEIRRANLTPLIAAITTQGQAATYIIPVADAYGDNTYDKI